MTDSALTDRLVTLVAPILTDLRLELYDIEHAGGVLRVLVDVPLAAGSEEQPVLDLDTLALVSRLVGRELDHADPISGRYTLEVSSPGLERTLRTPAHFRRAVGSLVTVRLRDAVDGVRRVRGRLVGADDTAATVRLEDPASGEPGERSILYSTIDRARTVFVWQAAAKPGRAGTRSSAARGAAATQEATAS